MKTVYTIADAWEDGGSHPDTIRLGFQTAIEARDYAEDIYTNKGKRPAIEWEKPVTLREDSGDVYRIRGRQQIDENIARLITIQMIFV